MNDLIGLVLVTHDHLGQEMLKVVNNVIGEECTEGAVAIAVTKNSDKNEILEKINTAVKTVKQDKGVIIVSDLHGATPHNYAAEVSSRYDKTSVISGINIPLLIKLCEARQEDNLEDALHLAIAAGSQYIRIGSVA